MLQTNAFLSQGPFYSASGVLNDSRLSGLQGDRDIRIVTYGASAAFEVVQKRFWIGESVNIYRFALNAHFASLGFQTDSFSPVDLQTAGQGSTTQQGGSGTQVGINIGALISVSSKLRIGAVYRQSVSFTFTETNNVPDTPSLTRVGTFRTPGVIGAGVRLQPWGEKWTLSADYDFVQYSAPHYTLRHVPSGPERCRSGLDS